MGCRFLLQGIFPTQGPNPANLMSPALAGGFFTAGTTWEACASLYYLLSQIWLINQKQGSDIQ